MLYVTATIYSVALNLEIASAKRSTDLSYLPELLVGYQAKSKLQTSPSYTA
ncbi:MAG: hypothetical protein QHH24_04765 [Candidatus Bathyarchaeota archaeon]|nr:hypothetical protein [Candidatus Bathyarchaeota archaeon]